MRKVNLGRPPPGGSIESRLEWIQSALNRIEVASGDTQAAGSAIKQITGLTARNAQEALEALTTGKQQQSDLLDAIAAESMVADRYIYGDGADSVALGTIVSHGRAVLADPTDIFLTAGQYRIGQDTSNSPGRDDTVTGGRLGVDSGDAVLFLSRADATSLSLNRNSAGSVATFQQSGTAVGSISVNSPNTAYNTTSDRRLKTLIKDLDLSTAVERVKAIRLVEYEWDGWDGLTGRGIIADELQEVVPEAVTGEKDAIEEEWVVDGAERYLTTTKNHRALDQLADAEDAHKLAERISPQMWDATKLVPEIIGALQSMMAEIAALKDEVAKMKAAR
ncbi:tail fiber domain-containing protein [Bauldia litoralis]|uniref:tail fiber domain-containing protein n=1 Tax=Bauldia litoralis TaxID=665467 RepID=UPI003263F379